MGVQARLVLWAPDHAAATAAARAAFARIAELDQVLSDYRAASELSRLGRQPLNNPVPLSPELRTVLARAQQLAEQSGGAFDITAGPLTALWREARRRGQRPQGSSLEAALERVGWHHLGLDTAHSTATIFRNGLRLDAGGIAKGYAGDEALATLARHGVTRALVELGGDIVLGDPPPGQEGWPVAVALDDTTRRAGRYRGVAISTSGDDEQFIVIEGRRHSHVIDPRSGEALTGRTGVTVIAPDGLTADGLATLLSVLGAREGHAFLRRHYPEVRAWIREAPGARP